MQARVEGNYPVLGYGNAILGLEHLKIGEVWKVGQTRNGEKGRYPSKTLYNITKINTKLTTDELEFIVIVTGNYKKILILEKILIYTYPMWSGHQNLLKPPGCKIYR